MALVLALPAGAQENARVRSLELEGNEHFSDRELRRVMTSSPGWWRKPLYHEATLSSDLNAVLAVYEGAGFLDAQVTDRQVTPVDDGEGVEVVVGLDEGPRTYVTSLTVDGAAAIDEQALRQSMGLAEGRPFRRRQLLADRARLEALYAESGRIETRIAYEAVLDTVGSARVAFRVQEGPPVRIDTVLVEGVDKTRPHIVLREVKLAPGDLCRRGDLAQTQTRVFSTGLFRSVTVGPAAGDPADTLRAVVVTVRERKAGALDVGVGYGSSERFRAGLSLAQTNWLGRGLRIGANVRASRLLRRGEGVFTVPYVFGHHVALDGRLYTEWERNPEAAFRTQKRGLAATFSYAWHNSWVWDVRYNLERTRFRTDVVELYEPGRTTSLLGVGLRRDSRDNPLDTRAGSLLRVAFDVAGGPLGGDSDYNRSTVEVLHFRQLWGMVWALHAQASGIGASGTARRVATYEQFFLGGDRSVRGYGRGEIGADRIGELALNLQLEVRLPLFDHGLVCFRDAGQVWTDAADVAIPGDLRQANGVGLRVNTRFGLLRLDAAVADEAGSLGDRLGIYLGVGQAF